MATTISIICERCGKIADFAMTKFPNQPKDVHKQTGYTTNRTKSVYGVCQTAKVASAPGIA